MGELLGITYLQGLGASIQLPTRLHGPLRHALSFAHKTCHLTAGPVGVEAPPWIRQELGSYCLHGLSGDASGVQGALYSLMGVACALWPTLLSEMPSLPSTIGLTREGMARDLVRSLAPSVPVPKAFGTYPFDARDAAGLTWNDLAIVFVPPGDGPPAWITESLVPFMLSPLPWCNLDTQVALAHLFRTANRLWDGLLVTNPELQDAEDRAFGVVGFLPVEKAVKLARRTHHR
jgi:hypothetical protein